MGSNLACGLGVHTHFKTSSRPHILICKMREGHKVIVRFKSNDVWECPLYGEHYGNDCYWW